MTGTSPTSGHAPDVAIIGGGIIGTAAAAMLAERGARVTLYESGPSVASAASGRNAGQLMAPPDPLLRALYDESLAAYRVISGTPVGDGAVFAVPDAPCGILAVGFDGEVVRRIGSAVAAAHPELTVEVLDPAALRSAEPLLASGLTAFRVPLGYAVRPGDATRAFATLAARRGAAIVTGGRARPWLEAGVARGVHLDGERRPAGAVLVAAGPWTPGLIDPTGAWLPIRPMWGVLAELALPVPPRHVIEEVTPDAPLLLATPPSSSSAVDSPVARPAGPDGDEEPEFLFTTNPAPPIPAGVPPTALGGTFIPFEPDPHRLAAALVRHATPYLPSIHEGLIVGVRACPRPTSLDGRPLIGHLPGLEGLVVAAGNGGWGISTGPATARLAVDALLSGSDQGTPPALLASRAGSAPG